MSRELQPCGTPAAYRRHLRAGEKPCVECLRAHSDRNMDRLGGRPAPVVTIEPQPRKSRAQEIVDDEQNDQLADAKRNLKIVREAMADAVPREIAALSKRRQELVALIDELSTVGEVSLADQLAEIRSRRSAGA